VRVNSLHFPLFLSLISGATNTVVATVTVGIDPQGVGVDPRTNMIYEANFVGTVSVISGHEKNRTAPLFLRFDGDDTISYQLTPNCTDKANAAVWTQPFGLLLWDWTNASTLTL